MTDILDCREDGEDAVKVGKLEVCVLYSFKNLGLRLAPVADPGGGGGGKVTCPPRPVKIVIKKMAATRGGLYFM